MLTLFFCFLSVKMMQMFRFGYNVIDKKKNINQCFTSDLLWSEKSQKFNFYNVKQKRFIYGSWSWSRGSV